MNNIDEKAILKLADWHRCETEGPRGERIWLWFYKGKDSGVYQIDMPNIYSLDWQAKYPEQKLIDEGWTVEIISKQGFSSCYISHKTKGAYSACNYPRKEIFLRALTELIRGNKGEG